MSSEQTAVVEVYTLSGCLHCARTRNLLRRRGIAFTEISGDGRPRFRRELVDLTGRPTVPQITVDGTAVGGASDLARLDRRGLLQPLTRREPFPRAAVTRHFSLAGLATAMIGGGCGPWRYAVVIVDRDGSVIQRLPASAAAARELVNALNSGDGADVGEFIDEPTA